MARVRIKKRLQSGWDGPDKEWNRLARKDRVKESKKEELWFVYWSEVRKWDKQVRIWGG